MKKSNLPPVTEHNVDIAPAQTRSDGNGRVNPATTVPPSGRRSKSPLTPAQPAPPRRRVVVDAEGYRTVVRRSSRNALSSDEDRDFQPEAPAKRPKIASATSKTPASPFALLQQLAEEDPSFGAEVQDVAEALSGEVSEGSSQVCFSPLSDSSAQNLPHAGPLRPKAKTSQKPRASSKSIKSAPGSAKRATPSKAQAPAASTSPEDMQAPSASLSSKTALTTHCSPLAGDDLPGLEQTLCLAFLEILRLVLHL